MEREYLESIRSQFEYYKLLGEKTLDQLSEADLFHQYNEESNSIAVIIKHLWGNMLSRWKDFLTTDGEKVWRDRDAEFDPDIKTKQELMRKWNEGWECVFDALASISHEDLKNTTVYIRNEPHTVVEAVNRQFAHYAYHVGQIVFVGKMLSKDWHALSIPKEGSKKFNQEMMGKK